LKKIGCSTAKNVLAMGRERLIREADLEDSTVDEVLAILRYEFEEEDDDTEIDTDMDVDMGINADADVDVDTDADVDVDIEMGTDEENNH